MSDKKNAVHVATTCGPKTTGSTNIPVHLQTPDLVPCPCWHFPKLKVTGEEEHSEWTQDTEAVSTAQLKTLEKEDSRVFQKAV